MKARAACTGFTLIEILIVVAIVGILAAVVYPAYIDQVRSSRRAEAKDVLHRVMQAEEAFHTRNSSYTVNLTGGGANALTFNNNPVRSNGDWYRVGAAACGAGINACVALTATARNDQTNDNECRNFTLNSRGQRGVTGTGTVANCW